MQTIISTFIYGLSTASVLFLICIGLSLCYGLMRIVSLDQVLYYSIGAYLLFAVSAYTNFWIGTLTGIVGACLLGLLVEKTIYNRVYEKSMMYSVITSFGVLLLGIGVIKYIWGLSPKPISNPLPGRVMLLWTVIPIYRVFVIIVAAAAFIFLYLLLDKTIIGKAIRAGIEDSEKLEALGVNIYKIFTIAFLTAVAFSALGGALHSPMIMVDPEMGLAILARVFMVTIIGGLGSVKGTMVSALLVGQVISFGFLIWAPLSEMAPFALMILVLLIKPTGLYGSKYIAR